MSTSPEELWDELTDEQLAAVSASENYRKAEALLWEYPSYPSLTAGLQQELDHLMPGKSRSVVTIASIPGSSPHDTSEPERWAGIRIEGKRAAEIRDKLCYLVKCRTAVDAAKILMSPPELRYVELRYGESRPHHQVQTMLNMPSRSYYRMRIRAIERVITCGKQMLIFPA